MCTNYSSSIKLDKKALANNIAFIRNLVNGRTKLSAVVKGNAYGHGVKQMLPALQDLGIDHFSVFSSYEAKQAFQVLNEGNQLMIMGDIPDEDVPWIVENELEFFVYNRASLLYCLEEAKKQNRKINIHVEIETGMHRHGFERENWQSLIAILNENRAFFNFMGICTHFAGAESSANFKRIENQQDAFLEGVEIFKKEDLIPKSLHTSSSAGIIAFPDWNMDMVRIGILQYGLWPSKEIQLTYQMKYDFKLDLKPVLSWHSSIMEIKTVPKREYVGYGNSYLTEREMKIASVPVGYGYGFSRALSNTGRVLVRGKRLSVAGMVNMNMFLIDVTDLEVQIGDRVTLIGKDGDQEMKVSYFGDLSDQMNYELLTRLDKSIPRSFVDED